MFALDKQYTAERAFRSRDRADNVASGLYHGVRELSGGVYYGVAGMVSQPVSGVQQEGVLGLAKGVGRGLLGVVVKPVVGAFDFASRVTEGLSNMSDRSQSRRAHPPRIFDSDNVVLPRRTETVGDATEELAAMAAAAAEAEAAAAADAEEEQQAGYLSSALRGIFSGADLPADELVVARASVAVYDAPMFHHGTLFVLSGSLVVVGLFNVRQRRVAWSATRNIVRARAFGLDDTIEVIYNEPSGSIASLFLVALTRRGELFDVLRGAWRASTQISSAFE